MSEQEKKHLQQLIANGKADEALEIILAKTDLDDDMRREYLLQKSRLFELEEKERKRTISGENAGLERNQINESLLNLLDGLPSDVNTSTTPITTANPEKKEPRNWLKTIATVVTIITALIGAAIAIHGVWKPTIDFVVAVREVTENGSKRIPLQQSGRVVVDFDNVDPLEFGIQNGVANCEVEKKLCNSLFTLDLDSHQDYVPTQPDFNYSLLDNNQQKDTIEFLIEKYIEYIVEVPTSSNTKINTNLSTNNSYIENNGSKFVPERIEGNKLIFKLPKSFDKTEKKITMEMGDTVIDTVVDIENKRTYNMGSIIENFLNSDSGMKNVTTTIGKKTTTNTDKPTSPTKSDKPKKTFEWEIEVGKEYKGEKIKLIYDSKGIGDKVGVVNDDGNITVQLPEGTKELKIDATTIKPGLRPNVEVNKNAPYRLPKL